MTIIRKSTVHAMFVWHGFMTQCRSELNWTDKDSDLYGGQIGAAIQVALAVDVLAHELDAFWKRCPEVSFPGVFDYEVSEALGGWLRLQSLNLNDAEMRLKARALIEKFFLKVEEG